MSSPAADPRPDSGRRRNQIAGFSASVSRAHAVAGVDVVEPLVDRVEHHEHRLDGRVVSPEEQVPGLVLDPVRWRRLAVWQRMLDEALAEHPGALPGGVGEALPAVLLGEVPGAGGEVPVQQEQRGEALLAVERPQRSLVDPAVDEVQPDGRRLVAGDGGAEDIEEVGADPPDRIALAALGVVALEERDLDALDGEAVVGLVVAGQGEERRPTALGGHASTSSGWR